LNFVNIDSTFNYTQLKFCCQDNQLDTVIAINKQKTRSDVI